MIFELATVNFRDSRNACDVRSAHIGYVLKYVNYGEIF